MFWSPKSWDAGETLMSCWVIVTLAEYSLESPSSSMILPFTAKVPGVDGAAQVPVLVTEGELYAAVPHLNAYVNVSSVPGSTGLVRLRWIVPLNSTEASE